VFAKYGLHLPLNRQSATYARKGIELDVSTLADWGSAVAATLMPLILLIRGLRVRGRTHSCRRHHRAGTSVLPFEFCE
jgi:transposase